ncbi:MAG: hypothetical protein HYS98_09190 [Deltaproteobacteria bacterium]|nr:hypothetical protein [Deltaproteobacteria bacterium]
MLKKSFSFYVSEFSGSLGDLPLFFIFFVGLTQFSNLNPINILFWSGLAHIIVGFVFKVPLPYQPMKGMGLVAIAQGVSEAELLSAGVLIGLTILIFNALGIFKKLYTFFPEAVIRGIQLGLAFMLLAKAHELTLGAHLAILPIVSLVCIVVLILRFKKYHTLWVLGIFGISLIYMFWEGLLNEPSLSFSGGFFKWHTLTCSETVLSLVLIQLPLTTANSIFSPALLLQDMFPEKKIKASTIATSVGAINLLTCLFGGMPACHGAGGLAAQYRCGARSGLSVIMLGIIKLLSAVFLGGLFLQVAQNFPRPLLALLFIFPMGCQIKLYIFQSLHIMSTAQFVMLVHLT